MDRCKLCPRECGADRTTQKGYCGAGDKIRVAKFMLHRYEEPTISGTAGSGAIFFGGCSLRCVYCQNRDISGVNGGKDVTADEVYDGAKALLREGAHNINFVTAGHYLPQLLPVMRRLKEEGTTLVYNTGGYEKAEAIAALEGIVDVYLPDYKYADSFLAERYSSAPDYPRVAKSAIKEMLRQKPRVEVEDGIMRRGVLVRHLVLPGERKNGVRVMETIASEFVGAHVSVMRQYTPPEKPLEFLQLNRKITSFEYDCVKKRALKLGLDGFFQEKGCENSSFTPDFNIFS